MQCLQNLFLSQSQALLLPECKYPHLSNAVFLSCVKSPVFGETTSTELKQTLRYGFIVQKIEYHHLVDNVHKHVQI